MRSLFAIIAGLTLAGCTAPQEQEPAETIPGYTIRANNVPRLRNLALITAGRAELREEDGGFKVVAKEGSTSRTNSDELRVQALLADTNRDSYLDDEEVRNAEQDLVSRVFYRKPLHYTAENQQTELLMLYIAALLSGNAEIIYKQHKTDVFPMIKRGTINRDAIKETTMSEVYAAVADSQGHVSLENAGRRYGELFLDAVKLTDDNEAEYVPVFFPAPRGVHASAYAKSILISIAAAQEGFYDMKTHQFKDGFCPGDFAQTHAETLQRVYAAIQCEGKVADTEAEAYLAREQQRELSSVDN